MMRLSEKKDTTIATACVACSVFTYGSVSIFLRFFKDYLDAWTVNAVRYAIAAMILLPFVLILRNRPEARKHASGSKNIWRAALVPAVINVVGQVLWALSPYYEVQAATMAFITKSSFLFTVLFGFLLIPTERLLAKRPIFFIGAAVCVGGVAILFARNMLSGKESSLTGMWILVATSLFWGAYAVSVRRYLGGYSLRLSFGVVSIYTAGVLLVLMFIFGKWRELGGLGDETLKVLSLLAASAVVGMVFSHLLYYRGIHGLGPVISNGILMATPFITYIGAWIFLDEKMTPVQIFGGVVIVVGGVLLVRSKAQIDRQKARPDEFIAPDR
jgi:drug/metabolite transporter (DMT)-like permease